MSKMQEKADEIIRQELSGQTPEQAQELEMDKQALEARFQRAKKVILKSQNPELMKKAWQDLYIILKKVL